MKLSLVVSCVWLDVLAVISSLDPALDDAWLRWKSLHKKQYTKDEEIEKREIWEDNMRFIEKHNQEYKLGKHTFTVGMNHFGDFAIEEYNEQLNASYQHKTDD